MNYLPGHVQCSDDDDDDLTFFTNILFWSFPRTNIYVAVERYCSISLAIPMGNTGVYSCVAGKLPPL